MRKSLSIAVYTSILLTRLNLVAQDLELIDKEQPLTVPCGVSLSQIFYNINNIQSRRDPYTYHTYGNVNSSPEGWSFPDKVIDNIIPDYSLLSFNYFF